MNTERRPAGRRSLSPLRLAQRLHRDQRGSLSIMGVFSIFFLTVLLGMIFNVGRQVDDKLRMQNAADAAAYSGTLTVSRGMNAIAYSNHLLCEIFALTAYMREARLDGNHTLNSTHLAHSEMSPDVLEMWDKVAEEALGSVLGAGAQPPLDKFRDLGLALRQKIDVEEQMVIGFREMSREHSRLTLSVFEYILRGELDRPWSPVENSDYPQDAPEGGLITKFQRSVVRFTPEMSQRVAQELAERHGQNTQRQHRNRDLTAVLFRTDASRFDDYQEENRETRLLPVIDPTLQGGDLTIDSGFDPQLFTDFSSLSDDQIYFKKSYDTRRRLAKHYLESWIDDWMDTYFTKEDGKLGREVGNLSQLANLWRVMTCAQLDKLLKEEFPTSNLPFVIRVNDRNNWDFYDPRRPEPRFRPDAYALEQEYHCVAIVAWPHTRQFGPGIYRNPLNGDKKTTADDTYAFTFAEAKFFLPRPRYRCCPWTWPVVRTGPDGRPYTHHIIHYDNWSRDWSMFNQNWRTKLVPGWTDELPTILAQHPGGDVNDLATPELRNLTVRDLHLLNSH